MMALVCAASLGCSGEMGSEQELEALSDIEQSIENGELYPKVSSNGVVLLYLQDTNGTYQTCSGQVLSRNTVLTAAHCFYLRGHTKEEQDVNVAVHHQKSDGKWESLQSDGGTTAELAKVYLQAAYLKSPTTVSANDIAIIKTAKNMSNIVQGDSAALLRDTTRTFRAGYAYGYGFKSDSASDGQLRRGEMKNLSFGTVITATAASTDPHLCGGDSGGSLKLGVEESIDGIQFGINSYTVGNGACGESGSGYVNVAYHIDWIKGKVGAARCVDRSFTQGSVKSTICW
jgi:secreted trypsin-like serine protease